MFKATDYPSTSIHEREVTIDGETRTFHFRELPHTDLKRYFGWELSTDEDVRAAAQARICALGVVTADGKPAGTWEEFAGMRIQVIRPLFREVMKVNGYDQQGQNLETVRGKPATDLPSNGSGT